MNASEKVQHKRKVLSAIVGCSLVAAFGCWSLTHGCEHKHVEFHGGFGSTDAGTLIGGSTVFAFERQKIRVDYDVKEIKRGRFYIHVWKAWAPPDTKFRWTRYVKHAGPGVLELTVPKTGLYDVLCDGSPDGNGYDITYTASWAVR